ncbi:hypothetical protein B0H66DRAFT_333564 [Apodospora peruviana]|uniref:Uncharacterized protein n=1 Tax=Apodospora peruviana TaxID=516989 RepID=A0AAE0HY89_9PEZI|nr:hypothetical protein B0H66DRAFT_333564 [Apodospora peruviana]
MKSFTVALGFCAALTSAYSHPRHMHFRRQNSTELATGSSYGVAPSVTAPAGTGIVSPVVNGTEGGLTTLTVIATSTQTITSCAATITNCPTKSEELAALPTEALITKKVTLTSVVTEVVCPVTEASSIQSSILAEASSYDLVKGSTTSSLAAESTPAAVSHVTSTVTMTSTHVVVKTTAKVVTITLGGNGQGGGEGPRVVTSTFLSEYFSNVVEVVTQTVSHEVGVKTPAAEADSTTTKTMTSTGTRTVTVGAVATTTETLLPTSGSSSGNDLGSDSGSGAGSGSGGEACDCAGNAVTVTLPASTVYMTMTVTKEAPASSVTLPVKEISTTKGALPEASESACPPDEVVTVTETESETASATETGIESVAPTLAPFPLTANSTTLAFATGTAPVASSSASLHY